MTNRIKLCVVALFALLGTTAFATMAFAKMNGPTGLAVDAKGNLYVASFNSNQILVYGPTHSPIKARTITNNISGPIGVAVDSQSNVWVANFSANSVAEYSTTGLYLGGYAGNPLSGPTALAVDQMGDAWVVNAASSLVLFDPNSTVVLNEPVSQLVNGTVLYNVAIGPNGLVAFGSDRELSASYAVDVLTNTPLVAIDGNLGQALAWDNAQNIYWSNTAGAVLKNGAAFVTLSYIPAGMAVDSKHGLIYFSNNAGNNVDVYTLAGVFVTTIH